MVVSPSTHSAGGAFYSASNGVNNGSVNNSRKPSAAEMTKPAGSDAHKTRRNVRRLLKGMSVDMAMSTRVGSNFRRISNTVSGNKRGKIQSGK